jgi:hypothetical protein
MARADLGIRWTIGAVNARGFDALRLSIAGAFHIFGQRSRYAVCVNSVPLEDARTLVGELPVRVEWVQADGLVPGWLRLRFDQAMGEGTAWKFAPIRLFAELPELALDNDCILWRAPEALTAWLNDAGSFLLAEDVRRCVGAAFDELCTYAARNSGIRGIPAGFDLETALRSVLARPTVRFSSELDEQGLQIATLERAGRLHLVSTSDVTICSPFWPHQPELGSCGAHFVGLNAHALPFRYYGRPATDWIGEHWARHLPALEAHVGLDVRRECGRAGGDDAHPKP